MERKRNVFTSDHRERLHPPSHKATVDKQARLLEFGEDVKKRLRLLSEVVLRTVKRRLAATFAIFLQKKWRRESEFSTSHCQAQKQIFYP